MNYFFFRFGIFFFYLYNQKKPNFFSFKKKKKKEKKMTYLIKGNTVALKKSALFSTVKLQRDEEPTFTGFLRGSNDRIWLYVQNCLFIYEKNGALWKQYLLNDNIKEICILKDGKAFLITEETIYAVNTEKETQTFINMTLHTSKNEAWHRLDLITLEAKKWVALKNGNLVLLLSDGCFWLYDPELRFILKSNFMQIADDVVYLGERFSDNLVYYVKKDLIGVVPNVKRILDHRVWNPDVPHESYRMYESRLNESHCKGIHRLNDRTLLTLTYRPFYSCNGSVYDLEEKKGLAVSYDFGLNFQENMASFHWIRELDVLLFVHNTCYFYDVKDGKSLNCFVFSDYASRSYVDVERKNVLVIDHHLRLTHYDISNGFVFLFSPFER